MWKYQNQELTNIPEDSIGYIYQITNLIDNKIYIGKKLLSSNRKVRLTKKEKLLPENKRKTFKRVIKETDWQNYWSSSDELKQDVSRLGKENFKREILLFVKTKQDLSYYETYFQMKFDVLFSNSYNKNILGKFYKGKINELKNLDK